MHKASFCLQAEKSVHLNNYVLSYPALYFLRCTATSVSSSKMCINNIFHNRVFLNKLIVKSKLLWSLLHLMYSSSYVNNF